MYLDHVDFGVRQVSDSIPRISVWKDGMIKSYAEFDLKSPGCYGYHPLLDVSRTCYSKICLICLLNFFFTVSCSFFFNFIPYSFKFSLLCCS